MTERILFLSLGSIGRRHLRNIRDLLPNARIAACRLHHTNGQEIPEGVDEVYFSVQDSISFAPDAVIVSSPATAHCHNAATFLNLGAHVFIEKPLAADHSEVTELLKLCRTSTAFSMVGYVLRFQPILEHIKQVIDGGELGDIHTARIEVGQYLPDWRPGSDYRKGVSAQRALGDGALLELSHELDYATWLFGFPQHILCSSQKLSDLEIDVKDSACVVMEYGKERKRVLVTVDFLQRVASMGIQIVGSQATLHADLLDESVSINHPIDSSSCTKPAPKMKSGNEMYLRQFDFFLSRCFPHYPTRFAKTQQFEQYVTVDRAARVLQLVDVAKRANLLGQRLPLET